MAAPFFSAYSYTNSNFSSNDGSIINIQVTGGTPNVLVNITGPNSYNQNYIAPLIPDQLNLAPGTYIMSVVDSLGESGNPVTIIIEEKPETFLTANISDACNCPDCDCVINVTDYVHNSNCFIYNLYDGTNPVPIATYQGCSGQEQHQFTGLCTGDYRIEAIELDEVLYVYGSDVDSCTPGELVFDEDSDPATIVANWNRFAFYGNSVVFNGSTNMPSGLDPVTGIISNAPGTYFERGNAFDLGDFNIPMTEGDDIGPSSANDPSNHYRYYYNTAINKYIVSSNTRGGSPLEWATFDPRINQGALGNPTDCKFLTSSTNWNTTPLTNNQYTIDSVGNVVLASTKLTTFPTMIQCLQNSGLVNGFYSLCNFNDYVHEITIGSLSTDDDNINIVIAAFKDELGVWGPIDQTHTLQLVFNSNGGITVIYNLGNSAYTFITPGTAALPAYASPVCCALQSGGGWRSIGNVRVKIVKVGSLIEIFLTDTMGDTAGQQNNATINIGSPNPYNTTPIFSFDLLDKNTWNPAVAATAIGDELAKFVTDIKIGYSSFSQSQSFFFDIAFTGEVVIGITEEVVESTNAVNIHSFEEPCELCYLATDCENPNNTMLITLPASAPALDLTATYIFNEFPDICWTVEESDQCGNDPSQTILLNTGFIDPDNTLGVEDDDDYNWELITESNDVPIVPRPAVISDQSWFTGYGSLFNALWITQTVSPHNSLGGYSEYKLEFVLPLGFVPLLNLDILTDNTAVITLNGFVIGDTTNSINYPTPWAIPANFTTSNPIHFIPNGTNTLIVRVRDTAEPNQSNGFALSGSIVSTAQPQVSTPVTVAEIFIDCTACLKTCYLLTDCQGLLSPIQTDTDLSAYLGQVITLQTCPDTCWTIEEIDCPLSVVKVYLDKVYPDCVTCLPSDPPPPPLIIRNRAVNPGYYTKGCSPDYVEKISCQWSEALFQQAASKRYGIEFCCSIDFDALDIKKQLMDFKKITDPDACVTTSALCCAPCGVTATLVVFNPTSCPAPLNVSAILIPPPLVVGKDCRLISFTGGDDAGNEGFFSGIDCEGQEIAISLADGQSQELCIDVSQFFNINAYMSYTIINTCS